MEFNIWLVSTIIVTILSWIFIVKYLKKRRINRAWKKYKDEDPFIY